MNGSASKSTKVWTNLPKSHVSRGLLDISFTEWVGCYLSSVPERSPEALTPKSDFRNKKERVFPALSNP